MNEKIQNDMFFKEKGDIVVSVGNEELTGIMQEITEEKFTVKWDDGQTVEYSMYYWDKVKKTKIFS